MDIIEVPLDIFPEIELSTLEELIIKLKEIKENKLKITSDPFNDKKAYKNIKNIINKMEETFKDIRDLLITIDCYIGNDPYIIEKIEDLFNMMDEIELEIKKIIKIDILLKNDSHLLESIIHIERLNDSLDEIIDYYRY